MRVLYLSQYFPPEVGATQTRAYEMVQDLVWAGHQVTMIAEVPNLPSGIIPPEYQGKLYERVDLDGIDVIRVWVKTSPVKTFLIRLLFLSLIWPVKMFSYMACQCPVLLCIEGEVVQLLNQAKAGLAISPEVPEPLVLAILDLQADPAARTTFGINGRAFVEANFSRQMLACQLEQLLSTIL